MMYRLTAFFLPSLAALCLLVAGCEAGGRPPLRDAGVRLDGTVPVSCTPGTASVVCMGNLSFQCNEDGTSGAPTDCAASGQTCVNGTGCQLCRPNQTRCSGANVERCNAAGTAYEVIATCDGAAGQTCEENTGTCRNACEDAAASNSYIGCDYWSTTMMNNALYDGFEFALVVSNPNDAAATVTVTRGGSNVSTQSVDAHSVLSIKLDWIDALRVSGTLTTPRSGLVRNGAYHVTSSLPVTVFQFNPLEYRLNEDCYPGGEPLLDAFDGACYSYTNDASLLLPTHVLTGNYIGVSWPSTVTEGSQIQSSSGLLTIVGAGDAAVDVTVTLSANTAASQDGQVAAGTPGSTQTYSLAPGDVLQLASARPPNSVCDSPTSYSGSVAHCPVGPEYDLTGTRISATGAVMVFGGHDCAFVPHNRFACDHLEETVFPLEVWDTQAIVAKSQAPNGRNEPNIVRIISGADGNTLTFDPPSVATAPTLARGEYFEFEASASFHVSGTGPILVAQFLVGQNYSGSVGANAEGDPAMSFAIPAEQYRSSYNFLAPSTYPTNFVGVTAPLNANVMLDGAPIGGALTPIGSTGYGSVQLSIPGGSHSMTADLPFGVVVYGYGAYTSYMYPGGLDLEQINPLI